MLNWPPDQHPELWSWQASTDSEVEVPRDANAFGLVGHRIAQRIGASRHVALLPYRGPPPPAPQPERDIPIAELWPQHGVPVDMRAAVPPGSLAQRYDEVLWGATPVALFVKQVLAKARSVLAPDVYTGEMRALLCGPERIEQRYSRDAEVERRAQAHRGEGELVPVSQVLRQLRLRETQLQVVLGLELLPAAPDIEPALDHHFDRLCIWQAVGEDADTLSEFCAAVVLPFYRSRCPHKAKHFLQRSRGTLKSRSRRAPHKVGTVPAAPLPAGGGLLRALQITGSTAAPLSPLPEPVAPESKPMPSLRPTAAVRSASHPLYTMASRHNTVEVRFKRSRKHPQPEPASSRQDAPRTLAAPASSVAAGRLTDPADVSEGVDCAPSAAAAAASTAALALGTPPPTRAPPTRAPTRAPPLPHSPPRASLHSIPPMPPTAETKVKATPKKERSRFLESLNEPLPIEFDAVESTDSDE